MNKKSIKAKGKRRLLAFIGRYTTNDVAYIWQYIKNREEYSFLRSFDELCYYLTTGYDSIVSNDKKSIVLDSEYNRTKNN